MNVIVNYVSREVQLMVNWEHFYKQAQLDMNRAGVVA